MRPRTTGPVTRQQVGSPASAMPEGDPEASEGQRFHQRHSASECSEGLPCSIGGQDICVSVHALPLTSCDHGQFL